MVLIASYLTSKSINAFKCKKVVRTTYVRFQQYSEIAGQMCNFYNNFSHRKKRGLIFSSYPFASCFLSKMKYGAISPRLSHITDLDCERIGSIWLNLQSRDYAQIAGRRRRAAGPSVEQSPRGRGEIGNVFC